MAGNGPAYGAVQSISESPEHGAMHQVKHERDATQVLAEASLEESFGPGHVRDRADQEGRGPEQEEPSEVKHRLGFQVGEIIPSRALLQDRYFDRVRWDSSQQDGHGEQGVVDGALHRLQGLHPAGKSAFGRSHLEVADHHASQEHGKVGAVHNVHHVVPESHHAPQPPISRHSRHCHARGVNQDGALEFHGNGPDVRVVVVDNPVSRIENEEHILAVAVPLPNFILERFLRLKRHVNAKQMWSAHDHKGHRNDGQVEAQPSLEERGRDIVSQQDVLSLSHELQGLHGQHVAREHQEARDGEVAAGEEGADERESGEVVIAVVSERVLQRGRAIIEGVSPQLVVQAIHHESGEASDAVQIRSFPQLPVSSGLLGEKGWAEHGSQRREHTQQWCDGGHRWSHGLLRRSEDLCYRPQDSRGMFPRHLHMWIDPFIVFSRSCARLCREVLDPDHIVAPLCPALILLLLLLSDLVFLRQKIQPHGLQISCFELCFLHSGYFSSIIVEAHQSSGCAVRMPVG